MFGKKKPASDFDFSDESLGKALENQPWHWYEGSTETLKTVPKMLDAVMRQLGKFEYGDYFYFVDRFGYLMRSSPKIRPPPENLGEKVAYFVDGIAVKIKDLDAKAKALTEAQKQ